MSTTINKVHWWQRPDFAERSVLAANRELADNVLGGYRRFYQWLERMGGNVSTMPHEENGRLVAIECDTAVSALFSVGYDTEDMATVYMVVEEPEYCWLSTVPVNEVAVEAAHIAVRTYSLAIDGEILPALTLRLRSPNLSAWRAVHDTAKQVGFASIAYPGGGIEVQHFSEHCVPLRYEPA
jgi:hypothetical protein